MTEPVTQKHAYTVSIHDAPDGHGALYFSFVPNGGGRNPNGIPKRVPQFVVAVRQDGENLAFDWSETPDDPGAAREEMQADIAARMKDRAAWIDRVTSLVGQVEQWAKELDWSTRRVDKKLEDDRIGTHRVPALLMQEDTCRFILEPIGVSSHGAEGIVDLYLMPAYDDVARLYFDGHRWNLHYMFPGSKPAATLREAEAMPLSKESLRKVIAELRQYAE